MLDFINIALRTIMCLAFIAFVVRPMLMSMVRREPNTLELEEMAQLAVNSAFKEQFAGFYAYKTPQLEAPKDSAAAKSGADAAADAAQTPAEVVEPVPLTEEELAALEANKAYLDELIRGHEEEMARRADLAAIEAERLAQMALDKEQAGLDAADDEEEDTSLEKMRQSMKKEKKKPAIPAELLAGNSYEDKLMVVRFVAEQEQNRVANAIRSMIKIGP
jgi:hypothetical protein